jgi:dUTP pyrophosphatase
MKIKMIDYGYKNLPKRAHYNDAGADVYCNEKIILWPHETRAIPLGFGLEIPDGFMGIIQPRSGHAKRGIIANIPPIDSGYRGEIHAIITNTTETKIIIDNEERVGQLVIIPIIIADFETELGKEREQNGFNSTGK